MKNRWIKFLLILLPLTLACTCLSLTPTPIAAPTEILPTGRLHFENELVAFDHPAAARVFAARDLAFNTKANFYDLGGELVAGFANPDWMSDQGTLYSSIGIFRYALPTGSSLENVMQAAYAINTGPSPVEVAEQSGPYTLDGRAAVKRTYRFASGPFWYTFQDIWLETEGSVFRISLNSEVSETGFEAAADLFLNSLDIKDNLPPFTGQPTPVPTPSPTPFPAALLTHYEDSLLAFDYPRGLSLLPAGESLSDCFPDIPFGGERLVGLGEPRFLSNGIYYRCVQITRLPMPSGSNLEAVLLDIYEQAQARFPQEPSSLYSTGPMSVAGLTGLQWVYRVTAGEPAYELRDTWLERDGQIYIISIWTEYTNPDDFWDFQSGAQALLDSLVIK